MKKIIFILSLTLFYSCTEGEEEIKSNLESYNNLKSKYKNFTEYHDIISKYGSFELFEDRYNEGQAKNNRNFSWSDISLIVGKDSSEVISFASSFKIHDPYKFNTLMLNEKNDSLKEKSTFLDLDSLAILPSESYRNSLYEFSRSSSKERHQRSGFFKVNLLMPDGWGMYDNPYDAYVLDAAEWWGFDLPTCDRAGASSGCAAKLTSGVIDQSEQSFLNEYHIADGYVLLCVCYVLQDSTFLTHQEENIY